MHHPTPHNTPAASPSRASDLVATSRDTVTIATGLGPVIAHRDGDVWRAYGIRYATSARFATPMPVAPWTRPFDAATPAPMCPQTRDGLMRAVTPGYEERQGTDEHCQRVSVTWPAGDGSDETLPVIVWIHGGSYVTGAGDLPAYDPRLLVSEQRVLVVSVTYRLGIFGFLGGDAGGQEGEADGFAPANLGLLDIVEALRWVRDNVAAFGGDPGNITAMGQSAGADAIACLMASADASGLFRRAVLQSAPLGIGEGRAAMTRSLIEAVGTLDPGASPAELIAVQDRATKAGRRYGVKGLMPFGPQWGHAPLPEESERSTATASSAHIDVMIGHLSDEGRVLAMSYPALGRAFRVPIVGRLLEAVTAGALARAVYERASRRFVAAHRRAGGNAVHCVLRWRAAGSPVADGHAMDMPLLLGEPRMWAAAPILGTETPERIHAVGARVRRVWADFAREGAVSADAVADTADVLTLS